MVHVVTDHCQDCRYTECVSVCPVKAITDSFYLETGADALVALNRQYSRELPVVDEKTEPLPTAEARRSALGL